MRILLAFLAYRCVGAMCDEMLRERNRVLTLDGSQGRAERLEGCFDWLAVAQFTTS